MDEMQKSLISRITKLEREIRAWRVIAVLSVMVVAVAASGNPAGENLKELQLASPDGRLKTSLSPYGLKFTWDGREIASIVVEGEAGQQEGFSRGRLQLSSWADQKTIVSKTVLSDGGLAVQLSDPYHRGLTIRGPRGETAIAPFGVMVPGGQFGVNQDGLIRLEMLDQNRLIAAIGAMGTFDHSVPLKKDSAALLLNDFGPDGKSHFITPSDAVVRGKAKDTPEK